jgi:hypothetical protein
MMGEWLFVKNEAASDGCGEWLLIIGFWLKVAKNLNWR